MNKEGKEPEKEKEEGTAPEDTGGTMLIAPNDYQVATISSLTILSQHLQPEITFSLQLLEHLHDQQGKG